MDKALVTNIKERLQTALLMSIFFPTILGIYFTAIKVSSDQIADVELNWSILLVFYLASYLLIEGVNTTNMREGLLKAMNKSIFVGIALFLLPISYLIAFHTPGTISAPSWIIWTDKSLFSISIQALQIVALIVLSLATGAAIWKRKNV